MPIADEHPRRAARDEASAPPLDGVRFGPPEPVASKAVEVTVRELQPVDAANRPLGAPYRLEYDELGGRHDLKDPQGAPVASSGNWAWGWATPHAAGHMRRRGEGAGLARFRIGPERTVFRERPVLTARVLQPVDAAARPVGRAYRLERDEEKGRNRVLDPEGAELGVVRGDCFRGMEYGLCWAERLVERDLRRGPRRGWRHYDVSAEVDGGPRDRTYLGTQRVEARTSAEALRAVPTRRFAGGLRPGELAVRLSAAALDDPDDRSHAVGRVRARERVPGARSPAASRPARPRRFGRALPPAPRRAARGPGRGSGPSR